MKTEKLLERKFDKVWRNFKEDKISYDEFKEQASEILDGVLNFFVKTMAFLVAAELMPEDTILQVCKDLVSFFFECLRKLQEEDGGNHES